VIEIAEETAIHDMLQGDNISLEDVKVGDFVRGPGAVKNGVFVPSLLATRKTGGAQEQN